METLTDKEIWKSIPGFSDYEVSNMGMVRSLKWRRIRILRPATNRLGYLCVLLYEDGKSFFLKIHKLVMLAFVGPCPDGMEVCHSDGSRTDNRLSNLRYDTHTANIHDCVKQNRMGSFTLDQVEQIRLKYLDGYSINSLVQEYDSAYGTISGIVKGESYSLAGGPISRPSELKRKRAEKIRYEFAAGGITFTELAKKYDLDLSTVSRIIKGNNHKNTGGPISSKDHRLTL